MALSAGNRIGPYEIVAALGAGGMGEVYRARDPRLGREVAIKVLPDAVALDAERLARFEREARVLAGLSHSGIASIFGVEEVSGSRALIMELVEGPTLTERIERGSIAEEEALAIARQLAEALEYAHEHGIVHRDLKPDNVKLRSDGTIKVLDFGLARALEPKAGGPAVEMTQSPTITQRMTQAGVILGTAAYMSPEQARGREADRRADVWAFGVVLYEMLSGRRAFAGETMSETLAAVMRDEPDWSALPSGISQRWRRLLERCLSKDPRRRVQAIGEARIVLEDLAANRLDPLREEGATPRPALAGRTAIIPWILATIAVVVAVVAVAMTLWRTPPPTSTATELSIVPAGGEQVGLDISYHPMAIAPDGRSIAYTTRVGGVIKLRLRRLDTREDLEIAGADGARNLFFSRDGKWIGFFDSRTMHKVSVQGGTPVELAAAGQDRLGTWLDDGTIVYSRHTTEPLYRIPESGGTPVAVTTLDPEKRERTHRFPCALDGGPWVVFTVQTVDNPGAYDDASIDAVSVKTGERRHLFKGARRAVWAPGGYLVLSRGSDLYAAPIDPRDPRLTTDPVPVLAGVSGDASSGASYFSIANEGTLAWLPGGEPEQSRDAVWLDRTGLLTSTPLPAGPYLGFRVSPDGLRALVQMGAGGGNSDLWLADLQTGAMNRLTHGSRSGPGIWFPDGVRIAYRRESPEGEAIVVRRLDGAGGERVIARAQNPVFVSGMMPDGRSVIYGDFGKRDGRLYLASVEGSAAPRELRAEGDGYEMAGTVSPDGMWLAYVTNKTGREEVCLRRMDGSGASWQLSNNQGGGVRWGRGGREIFFVIGEKLTRVSLTVHGDELSIGQPEQLFDVPPSALENTLRDYDYDPVHDRFLFARPPRGVGERREIALSLGWAKRLKSRLGEMRGARQ
ncbi:MAG TPA: protein kinase [Candidatus Polarisedimenticolia bacterium]